MNNILPPLEKFLTATTIKRLAIANIFTPIDLLLYFPTRYEVRSKISTIRSIQNHQADQTLIIDIQIHDVSFKQGAKKMLVLNGSDGTDSLTVYFFNVYPSQIKSFQVGTWLRLVGKVKVEGFYKTMLHPEYQIIQQNQEFKPYIVSIYSEPKGVTSKLISTSVQKILNQWTIPNTLIPKIQAKISNYPDLKTCFDYVHFPPMNANFNDLILKEDPIWDRIKFDEALNQQLSLQFYHLERKQKQAVCLSSSGVLASKLLNLLEFELTSAQKRVLDEITQDLGQNFPMRRLLQGDVGSGKTVIAGLSALQAVEKGYQVAFMAPTDVLAYQHFQKLSKWYEPLGIEVGFLSGQMRTKFKKQCVERLSLGLLKIVVGTHALFQESVQFNNLSYVIIDEQHRFGVNQRLALTEKGNDVHVLMMSATPIPRTLAMSYFADLDVSTIDELPPNRQPVLTRVMSNNKRFEVIERLKNACLEESRQIYWVCPLIDESEKLSLQSVMETEQELRYLLPQLRIRVVHGQMNAQEKTDQLDAFRRHEFDILIATTVIEVGVDIPNANIMIIDHAERMGLSQLHQLRGRIGRGQKQGICLLLYASAISNIGKARLQIIRDHQDGFEISRQDLLLRGPGEFIGERQSGSLLFKTIDLERDQEIIELANQLASEWLNTDLNSIQQHLVLWGQQNTNFLNS